MATEEETKRMAYKLWQEEGQPDGKPDVKKIKPIVFNLESSKYYAFGDVIAKAYSIGKELKPKSRL